MLSRPLARPGSKDRQPHHREIAMSFDLTTRKPADLTRIDVGAPYEVHWWSLKFCVAPEDIHAAVAEVGPSAEEVAKKLKNAAKIAFRGGGED
jgi:hypothetical protein